MISDKDREVLKEACGLSMKMQGEKHCDKEIRLNAITKNLLAEKILLLPEDFIAILFSRYIFHLVPSDIKCFLGIKDAKNSFRYVRNLLSMLVGLEKGNLIHDSSMESACRTAFGKYLYQIQAQAARQELSLKQKNSILIKWNSALQWAKRAAMFIITLFIGFSMMTIANAQLREQVFQWFVKTFPQYTEISGVFDLPQIEYDFERLAAYRPAYIPDGYVLVDEFVSIPIIVLDYSNEEGQTISIEGRLPTGGSVSLDTENVDRIHHIEFEDRSAYWWQVDGFTYFVWQSQGFEFNIITELDIETTIEIATSVK